MGQKDFDVPPEVNTIKSFAKRHLQADVSVLLQPYSITITTSSAALAGALRPLLHELKKELDTDKKVFIRIGV
jgi:hypothetical protein